MKTVQKILISRWGLLLLVTGIVVFVFILVVQQVQSQGDNPPYPPPPTPILTPYPSDNTATPVDSGCCYNVYPTPTPTVQIIPSQTVDLSPELSEEDEYSVYVTKNTGEIILYLIGPLQGDFRDSTLPDAVIELLSLAPGDEIIRVDRPIPWPIQMVPETPSSLDTPPPMGTPAPAYP